ncbi:MAG TPA: tetratricopeptide repeat protein [Pirellulales bacterium]|nr:tetratricopeptide repeat protein [Pirellulales bacterium]
MVVVAGMLCWLAWQRAWLKYELAAARESLRQSDSEAAADRLQKIVARAPHSAEAEYLLAAAVRRAGKFDQVAPHLARAAELGWSTKDLDRQRSLAFFQVGDFRTAGPDVMEMLLEDANDDEAEEAYEALTRGYTTAMLFNQANFILDAWIHWRPESARAWLMRADLAALSGNVKGETAACREVVRFDPKHREARRRLAYVLSRTLENDEAFEIYFQLHREQPNDPETMLGLAEGHHRRGETAEAKRLLARLLELDIEARHRASAFSLLGQIAMSAKDYAEAARVLKGAVELIPGSIPINYAYSRALSGAGRDEEAKVYIERYKRLQKLEDNLQPLRDALIARPGDSMLRSQIGETLVEMGETEAGVNWLLSVLLHDPGHRRTHRLLAEHYEKTGERELARKHRAVAEAKNRVATSPVLPPAMTAPREATN